MMETGLLVLAALTFVVWLIGGGQVGWGSRQLGRLRDVAPKAGGAASGVSIVVAARNEERGVAKGMQSLLAQRGTIFEIIAVDDRSDDGTGAVLDRFAARDPRVRVLHLDDLPGGWLGKTHALHRGAAMAHEGWLLFTDADVVMAPSAVARARTYAEQEGLDHLTVTPELRMPTPATDLFGGAFVLLFTRYSAPWKARDPGSRHSLGVGAFNLVRRRVYATLGGHSAIRMRPDDDMALGRIIKEAGGSQDVLYGTGEIVVEWYSSLRECIRGLEKNAFTGLGYSMTAAIAACLALLVFGVWPWIAVFFTEGAAWWLNVGSVLAMAGLYLQSTRASGADPRLTPALPLAVILFCFTLLRAAVLAVTRGEIRWRGTSYTLEELRRSRH